MTQPLFFDPDPNIPDSDLLGYGDLVFDGGRRQYLNGDPEISSMLPPIPQAQPDAPDLMPPNGGWSGHEFEQQSVDPLTAPDPEPQRATGMQPVPIPGSEDYVVDPMTGQITGAGAPQMPEMQEPEPQGAMATGPMEAGGMGGMPPAGGAPPSADPSTPVPIPGSQYQVVPATGEITPLGAGSSAGNAPPAGAPGLQVTQREGALPPELVAQQSAQRATMDANQLGALESSRAAEANIYRTAALQRQGQLDAEKAAADKQLAEQQAKVDRWKNEQTATAGMDIKTDLVSAQGDIGAVFSILGAAMLGYVGSDAGLRMIDSAIDQNVKKQINMRDSKLHVLADQIGSTEQAIAAGKATLYKIAADKAEATEKITKADAFEAQTPSLIADLRQKQQLFEQEQQRLSLGKTLEKAPVFAAPKASDVQKYGKAAADQEQSQSNILRAARELGLTGWDPKTGKFKNRDEVLKEGIPGVGAEDTFARDVGKVPILGEIPKALDNLATSSKGVAVRAALESLVAAEASAQNPGRAPTDADRDAARLSLGLNTEEGTVRAIERLMGQQETAKAQNKATYGSGAAGAYESSMGASGTRRPAAGGDVDMGRPLTPGSARQELQQERARPAAQGPQAKVDPIQEVAGEVQAAAGRELPPEGLKILTAQAAHETGDGQHAPGNNFFGMKAVGKQPANDLETTEGEGAEAKRTRGRFAAYQTPRESVDAVVSLLKRKYPDAWRALEVGDAPAYVAALKDGGYFTGSESEYLNGVLRRL